MEHAIIMIIAIIMITRLNIWSSPMSIDRLKSESGCDGEKSVMGTPDLLAWETSRWDICRLQRDEEFSIPGFLGWNFAKSRGPGIFGTGLA